MKQDSIRIAADSQAKFNNNTAFCIGTGRMGLALQQEYQQQLAMAQAECAFTHIRGHGLFSDDTSRIRMRKEIGTRATISPTLTA